MSKRAYLTTRTRAVAMFALIIAASTAAFSTPSSAKFVNSLLVGGRGDSVNTFKYQPASGVAGTRAMLAGAALQDIAEEPTATVFVDKPDYLPGETVTITGSNWAQNEVVMLTLHKERGQEKFDDIVLSTVSDGNGDIKYTDYSPNQGDLGVSYTLYAEGAASQRRAATAFTDGGGPGVDCFSGTYGVSVSVVSPASRPLNALRVGDVLKYTASVTSPGTALAGTAAAQWYRGTAASFNAANYNAGSAIGVTNLTFNYTVVAGDAGTNFRFAFGVLSGAATCNQVGGVSASVTVVNADTVAPVIAPHADVNASAVNAGGAVVNYTAPAATDNVDASVTVNCSPAPGSQFALGTTTVTCTASDLAGNAATPTTFKVIVSDNAAPVIAAHAAVNASAVGATGAVVNYTAPSATDNVDSAVSVSCSPLSGTNFALGTTQVTCSASDAAGNAATPTTFNVVVSDNTAPVIAAHGTVNASAVDATGANVTYTAPTATDNVDASVAVSCAPASSSKFALGSTQVTCAASDAAGNAATPTTFNVVVSDNAAPVIAPHADVNASAVNASGAVVNYTAPTASDNVDSSVSVSCAPISGSQFALGHTTVTCTASDLAGNAATATTFDVIVSDNTAPVITLNGPAELTVAQGGSYSDQGATAADNVDGDITANIVTVNGVNTTTVGDYTVTYNVSDAAGNPASEVTRTVHVTDQTPPVIAAHAAVNASAVDATGANVTYTAPTATDNVDSSVTVNCSPVSGSKFALGSTQVTCAASDAAGNAATPTTFNVIVSDNAAPVIAPHGTVSASAVDATGANVTYALPAATDNVDSSVTVSCSPASGGKFALGTTQVTCNASDAAGNAATPTTFNVVVSDNAAPVIAPHADVNVAANNAGGAVVSYALPAATDNVDASVTVNCSPAPGSQFALGTTTVTCTASDLAGNAATPTTFKVKVSVSWSNFLQPINLDGSSVFKLGSTIPVKFALTGDSAPITNGVFKLYAIKVSNIGVGSELEVVSTSAADSGNTFRYDPTGKQYIFNLSTKSGFSDGSWQLRADLGDGVQHVILISIKK